ncbi:MAG: hypothetical protein GY835_06225 [bacterium]|nr:hypothetical protein [bacterium]
MKRYPILILLVFLVSVLGAPPVAAYNFGKNKVHYGNFDWQVFHSPHFDLYYYPSEGMLASEAILIAEQAWERLAERLDHKPSKRIPLVIYGSHPSFQQTNISPSLISESTGGFTDTYRSRVVLPYNGSLPDFRHVIIHELVHVFMLDILFGGNGAEFVMRDIGQFRMPPLWFIEGLAEYLSTGWDATAQLHIEDAVASDYLIPLTVDFHNFMAYKEGQAVMRWLTDEYGEGVLTELLREMAGRGNMHKALEKITGLDYEDLDEKFQRDVKKSAWATMAERPHPSDDAFSLLNHKKTKHAYHLSPVFSPDGSTLAFFADHDGEVNLYLASSLDGSVERKLVTGQRSGDFESMHAFDTGVTFSPDGERLAFSVLQAGRDELVIIDRKGKELNRFRPELDSLRDPSWSPDGKYVAFSGSTNGVTDIYLMDAADGALRRLTENLADEQDVVWVDNETLLFARHAPLMFDDYPADIIKPAELDLDEFGQHPEIFNVGTGYDIWIMKLDEKPKPRLMTAGDDRHPLPLDDGSILFVSDAGGLQELWVQEISQSTPRAVYGPTGGINTPSLSSDENRLLFASLTGGGFDVFVLENLAERMADNSLVSTGAAAGDWRFTPFTYAFGPEDLPLPLERSDEEPDSLTGIDEPYKTRYLVDAMGRQVAWDTLYGFYGNTVLRFKDVLGDKEITVVLDIYGKITDSNMLLSYTSRKRRMNWTVGGYAFFSYYQYGIGSVGEYFGSNRLALEWRRGAYTMGSYPFSMYSRLDMGLNVFYSRQEFYEGVDPWGNAVPVIDPDNPDRDLVEKRTIAQPSLTYVYDDALFGNLGPVKGSRWTTGIAYAQSLGGDQETSRLMAYTDWRRYLYGPGGHSLALRIGGQYSEGVDPLIYYLGGPSNLRGLDYLTIDGTRTALASLEWRFPFIHYIAFGGPLPMILGGIGGTFFADVGGAWYGDDFHPFTERDGKLRFDDLRGDIGYGIRLNLGGVLAMWDFAWPTDLRGIGDKRIHFSLGMQF